MRKRLWVKQKCWFAYLQALNGVHTVVPAYHHAPPAQHMKKTPAGLSVEAGYTAHGTSVK
jgi:hypothetical protein